jgi:hypothetical protein
VVVEAGYATGVGLSLPVWLGDGQQAAAVIAPRVLTLGALLTEATDSLTAWKTGVAHRAGGAAWAVELGNSRCAHPKRRSRRGRESALLFVFALVAGVPIVEIVRMFGPRVLAVAAHCEEVVTEVLPLGASGSVHIDQRSQAVPESAGRWARIA